LSKDIYRMTLDAQLSQQREQKLKQ